MTVNYTELARAAVPRVRSIIDARNAATESLKHPPRITATPPADVVRRAGDALLAGEPLPADLGAQLVEFDRQRVELEAWGSAVRRLIELFTSMLEIAEQQGSDAMLGALRPELERILDQARCAFEGIAPTVCDAASAIESGPEAARRWSELGDIVADYNRLRKAQWEITRAGWALRGGTVQFSDSTLGLHVALRDVDAIWNPSDGTSPPWPCDPLRPAVLPEGSREFLHWAVKHPRHLWLPTLDELISERERFTDAIRPPVVPLEVPA